MVQMPEQTASTHQYQMLVATMGDLLQQKMRDLVQAVILILFVSLLNLKYYVAKKVRIAHNKCIVRKVNHFQRYYEFEKNNPVI